MLTKHSVCDIIIKLSRETRVKRTTEKLENCIRRQTCGKNFMKVAEKFGRKRQLPEKTFSKNFKKVLDKRKTTLYNNKAVTRQRLSTESDSDERMRAKRFDIKET